MQITFVYETGVEKMEPYIRNVAHTMRGNVAYILSRNRVLKNTGILIRGIMMIKSTHSHTFSPTANTRRSPHTAKSSPLEYGSFCSARVGGCPTLRRDVSPLQYLLLAKLLLHLHQHVLLEKNPFAPSPFCRCCNCVSLTTPLRTADDDYYYFWGRCLPAVHTAVTHIHIHTLTYDPAGAPGLNSNAIISLPDLLVLLLLCKN